MTTDRSNSPILEDDDAFAVDSWTNYHAVAMLAAAVLSETLSTAAPITLIGVISFGLLWRRQHLPLSALKPYGGAANYLTALRLVLILCAAALMPDISRLALLVLFGANVAMDVADGYLARRNDQVTPFGGVFDREADAVFVLVAYLYFHLSEDVGAWILLPGILPYLYRLAVWKLRDYPLHENKQRLAAVLAGTNYVFLLAAIAAPAQLRLLVLIVSTGIVMSSFLVSFWNLFRHEYSIS